jgi:nitrate/TMAO reductase-like tetraheme cytochrome c subunit
MALKDPFGFGNPFVTEKKRDSRRTFTRTQKNEIWAQQSGKCAKCHKKLDPRTVEYDHVKPWAARGKTVVVNGAALCSKCHKLKTHNTRLKKIDKKRKKPANNPFGLGKMPKFGF